MLSYLLLRSATNPMIAARDAMPRPSHVKEAVLFSPVCGGKRKKLQSIFWNFPHIIFNYLLLRSPAKPKIVARDARLKPTHANGVVFSPVCGKTA